MAVTTPDGDEVIVSRPSPSEVAAFSAVCTHQGCTVTPEGARLRCPCHGSVFDSFTGRVDSGPASQALSAVRVQVVDGHVVTT